MPLAGSGSGSSSVLGLGTWELGVETWDLGLWHWELELWDWDYGIGYGTPVGLSNFWSDHHFGNS